MSDTTEDNGGLLMLRCFNAAVPPGVVLRGANGHAFTLAICCCVAHLFLLPFQQQLVLLLGVPQACLLQMAAQLRLDLG